MAYQLNEISTDTCLGYQGYNRCVITDDDDYDNDDDDDDDADDSNTNGPSGTY